MVTPMDSSQAIDSTSLERFAKHLATSRNVAGLVTTARIGEGPVQTFEEQALVARAVRAAVGPEFPVIATINPRSSSDARDQVADLAPHVDAVMVFPPLFLAWGKVPSEVKVRFFRDVAENTPAPIVLFQVPVASYWFSPEEIRDISLIEGVVCMKEASFDMQRFGATLAVLKGANPSFPVLNGNDRFVAEGALMGAHGALIGIANVLPSAWGEILRLAADSQVREAMELQAALRPAQETIFGEPILDAVARIKVIAHAEGLIDSETVRPPQLGITDQEKSALLRTYEDLRSKLERFTN